jgi:hypothetical protein
VNSYAITGASGTAGNGTGCRFLGEGDSGVWPGAPIVNNAFSYQVGVDIVFQGTFPGSQSAAGTFRFFTPPSSTTAGCDTGTVSWTATTTATPPPGGGTGGGGSGSGTPSGSGGGTGGKPSKHKFATRLSFHKLSSKLVGGQIRSSNVACRAGSTITLWRGSRRIATTRSKAQGKFQFARSAKVRGHAVRASVAARTVKSGICAAGSSTFIKG